MSRWRAASTWWCWMIQDGWSSRTPGKPCQSWRAPSGRCRRTSSRSTRLRAGTERHRPAAIWASSPDASAVTLPGRLPGRGVPKLPGGEMPFDWPAWSTIVSTPSTSWTQRWLPLTGIRCLQHGSCVVGIPGESALALPVPTLPTGRHERDPPMRPPSSAACPGPGPGRRGRSDRGWPPAPRAVFASAGVARWSAVATSPVTRPSIDRQCADSASSNEACPPNTRAGPRGRLT